MSIPSLQRAASRPFTASLIASLVVGAVCRLWAVDFGLPYTQARPDETLVIDVVLKFLRGDVRPDFHDYPWLFMYLSAGANLVRFLFGTLTGASQDLVAYVASWPVNWAPFFLINRGISVVFGTLTIWGVFAVGRRVGGDLVGAVGAFLMAICFLPVRDSHYGTTDTTMTLFIVLCVASLLRAHDEDSVRWYILAGVAAGLASGTKYSALALGSSIVCAQVLAVFPGAPRRASRWPMVYAGVPFALVFLLCVPFVYLDWTRFRDSMTEWWQWMQAGQSGGPILDTGWWYHLRLSLRFGLGLPLLATGLIGIGAAVARAWRPALLLLSFPVGYFVVIGMSRNVFFRYALPIAPFLCITAGLAIVAGVRAITQRWPRLQAPAVVAATLMIAAPSVDSVWKFNRILSQTDNRVLVQQFVEAHAPTGSSILQSGSMYGHAHFRRERSYVRWVWDKGRMAFMVGNRRAEGRPDWILLQESPLPSTTQPIVTEFLRNGYTEVQQFRVLDLSETGNLYDIQDAFFVPYAGFRGVARPGPNFVLYRRADLMYAERPGR